ncbi:U-box domain-containing protein 1 [Linum perenne]
MSSARRRKTIAECLSDLQTDAVDLQQKALQTLASLTKVSPQNRNLIAETEDTLPTLLNLMKSPVPVIQCLSLSVLFNLSLTPELKHHMADIETIQYLNSIVISTSSPEATRSACSFICSLAMLDKNKAMFGVAGTIQVLVKAISGPQGVSTHHLLSCLAELVQFHGNCTLAVGAGAVKVLVGIVESPDGEDVAGTSLAILNLLGRFEEGLNELIKSKEVVRFLVDGLKIRCMMSKEGSAEILMRVVDESEECMRDAFELPELLSLLADISVRGSAKAREKADLLMKKMTQVANNLDTSFEL